MKTLDLKLKMRTTPYVDSRNFNMAGYQFLRPNPSLCQFQQETHIGLMALETTVGQNFYISWLVGSHKAAPVKKAKPQSAPA